MFIGSFVPAETPRGHFVSTAVLTVEGIMEKHDLRFEEFKEMEHGMKSMKLIDILFHYPDGPRYDIALYLLATS